MNIGNYTSQQLVNLQEMASIVNLIISCKAQPAIGRYYFEIMVAPNHVFDRDKLKAIFQEDCEMTFQRGRPGVLKGTIKDEMVGAYLYSMWEREMNC